MRKDEFLFIICERGILSWNMIYKVRNTLSERSFKAGAWTKDGVLAVTKGGSLCLVGKEGFKVLGFEWLFRRKVVRMWSVEDFNLTFIRDETDGVLYVWKEGLTKVGENFISVSFDVAREKLVGLCEDGRILEMFLTSEEGGSFVKVELDKTVFAEKDVKWFHGVDLWMRDRGFGG